MWGFPVSHQRDQPSPALSNPPDGHRWGPGGRSGPGVAVAQRHGDARTSVGPSKVQGKPVASVGSPLRTPPVVPASRRAPGGTRAGPGWHPGVLRVDASTRRTRRYGRSDPSLRRGGCVRTVRRTPATGTRMVATGARTVGSRERIGGPSTRFGVSRRRIAVSGRAVVPRSALARRHACVRGWPSKALDALSGGVSPEKRVVDGGKGPSKGVRPVDGRGRRPRRGGEGRMRTSGEGPRTVRDGPRPPSRRVRWVESPVAVTWSHAPNAPEPVGGNGLGNAGARSATWRGRHGSDGR